MTFLPWFHYALIGFLVARLGLLSRTAASAFILPALIVVPRKPSSSPSSLHATANEGYVQVSRPDGRKHQLFYRIARPMSLSSTQAAPIVALHGGPSVPSSYLYPLEDVVPYRSIVFYDQLGCGKSDEPKDLNQYSIKDSVEDLKLLLKKLGIRRFHLYGQSYGGILAYEYMKSVANSGNSSTSSSSDNNPECLSAILSSAPSNVSQIEGKFISLLDELKKSHAKDNEEELSDAELQDLFRINHQFGDNFKVNFGAGITAAALWTSGQIFLLQLALWRAWWLDQLRRESLSWSATCLKSRYR